MSTLNSREWAYLAGFVDAEGCINIKSSKGRYYQLQVIISQIDKGILDYWHKKTGLGGVYGQQGITRKPNHSQSWQWVMSSNKAEELLVHIAPYLVMKQEEAQIALEFLKQNREDEQNYKGKGVPRITPEMLARREEQKKRLSAVKQGRKIE